MKIILHKLFPYAPYLNEYIGFEKEIDENTQDPLEEVEKLRLLAEQSHKEKYPHLYTESGSPVIIRQIESDVVQESSTQNMNGKRKQVDRMPADKAIKKRYLNAIISGDKATIEKLKEAYLLDDVTEGTHTEQG